jgi:hypothetical protein
MAVASRSEVHSAPGRGRIGDRAEKSIELMFSSLRLNSRKADHFTLADLRIRCSSDEPEGANVVVPGYCR